MKVVNGMKTYVVGLAMILVGVVEMTGYDLVQSVTTANAFEWIMAGLALMTGRSALKKLEK